MSESIDFRASIPLDCKPSQAISQDDMRPVLTHGWIEHDEDGCWLTATDSYILARIPVDLAVHDASEAETIEQRRELLPEVLFPAAAMRALDGAHRFQVDGDLLRIDSHPALYPLPNPKQFVHPSGKELVAQYESKSATQDAMFFDHRLLSRLACALGRQQNGVKVEFTGPRSAIRVINPAEPKAQGLLMPIREVA